MLLGFLQSRIRGWRRALPRPSAPPHMTVAARATEAQAEAQAEASCVAPLSGHKGATQAPQAQGGVHGGGGVSCRVLPAVSCLPAPIHPVISPPEPPEVAVVMYVPVPFPIVRRR